MKIVICFLFTCFLASINGGKLVPLIIGGELAQEMKFPWQASIRKWSHICGGSIINSRWILTSASCIIGYSNCELKVVVGTNKLYCGYQRIYESDLLITHHWFNKTCHCHNIGMIRVTIDIEYNERTKPIRLPCEHIDGNANNLAIFTGWGLKRIKGTRPNDLQSIELTLLTYRQCAKKFPNAIIIEYHICGTAHSGTFLCDGDEGGPLVLNDTLVGIASYTFDCKNGQPDIFTNVYEYLDWIYHQMAKF